MNSTAKNLIRVAGVVVGLGAAVWAMRDRLLPAPEVHSEPPPRFREAKPLEVAPAAGGDVTLIKGVGPVTAGKLAEAGYADIPAVASSDAHQLASAIGVSESVATRWIASARALT